MILIALALATAAQATTKTSVSNDTNVKNGVVTQTHKVTTVHKRKTRRPKKVLGVKVGHKTAVTKVEKKTTTDSAGNASTETKVTH